MNILSLQKDVAYVIDQLRRAKKAGSFPSKNDCIERAMDGMERIQEEIKDMKEPSDLDERVDVFLRHKLP
jgi:hypothetical protein